MLNFAPEKVDDPNVAVWFCGPATTTMRTTVSCTSTRITHRRTRIATTALGLHSRYTTHVSAWDRS